MFGQDSRFKFIKNPKYCSCTTLDKSHGLKNFTIQEPVICYSCREVCCQQAVLFDDKYNVLNFNCPKHGSCREHSLNYTIGT